MKNSPNIEYDKYYLLLRNEHSNWSIYFKSFNTKENAEHYYNRMFAPGYEMAIVKVIKLNCILELTNEIENGVI